jgi:PAS domain S-box-containing protein
MIWLAGGVLYSLGYLAGGWLLRNDPQWLVWFRIFALLIAPLSGIAVIARRRQNWAGCQWLFWATLALGLTMSSIGLVGWTVEEILVDRQISWLGWHTVFALFGAVAPLFALLAQPHRGSREGLTASTAVDIAGIAVMTGFFYSHFIIGPDLAPITTSQPSLSLLLLYEFQQFVVFAGMALAAIAARRTDWGATYRRLAIGLLVNFVTLTISNLEIWQGLYRAGFVYDLIWVLPFAFYAWAAAAAPASDADAGKELEEISPSRPWIVFGALGLIPLMDFGLRQLMPIGPLEGFRDLFTAITVFSVLPLLMARLAVERGEARQADRRRQLLAEACEQADDFLVILTPDGRITHANRAFCLAVGYTQAEIIGSASIDLLAEPSRSQPGVIFEAVRTEGVWRGTIERRRKDGSIFPSSCTVVSLKDDRRQITHFVVIGRDISSETKLRNQLIHNERLAAVGQLISGVAHELNNPLQSIVGFTELLIDAERRQDVRTDLDRVRTEAHRAAKIVRNLLAFVRRSAVERSRVEINEIVRTTIALRRYELARGTIELEEEYAESLPPVMANREEIQQVLLNLILNAEQAMKTANGRGRLKVRTALVDGSVTIDVADDGPGVPRALAGQIFEPFFSTKDVGQGTGLGLSIALGIAEAHGGSLALVPAEVGAFFRLTLPAVSTPSVAAPRSPSAGAAASPPEDAPAAHRRRALVIDDDPALVDLLERLLVKRGFAVEVAPEGARAADLLDGADFDVIFCNIQMPRLGGMALYETLRRRQPQKLAAFAFISGDILNAELRQFADAAQAPLLSKPFGLAKLDAVLAEVLARRASSGGARTLAASA